MFKKINNITVKRDLYHAETNFVQNVTKSSVRKRGDSTDSRMNRYIRLKCRQGCAFPAGGCFNINIIVVPRDFTGITVWIAAGCRRIILT